MTTNKPEVLAYRVTWHDDLVELYEPPSPKPDDWDVKSVEPLIRLSDYEKLQAECEQLRKDAEKYRWLTAANSGPIGIVIYDEDGGIDVAGPQADEVIDAAMAGGSQ